MLRYAEEILLLALDDITGRFHSLPPRALEFAIAGALLGELALMGQVRAEADALRLLDTDPTNRPKLDETLATLREVQPKPESAPLSLERALAVLTLKAPELRDRLLQDLVAKGILRQEAHKFFFFFDERRYPLVDDREEKEVRARIREIILNNRAPNERDSLLIALMRACELSRKVFTQEEAERYRDTIREVAERDAIGRVLTATVRRIQEAELELLAYSGM
ncbi:MAG: GPP34 family phosphoprotein [Opitutales bacterium]